MKITVEVTQTDINAAFEYLNAHAYDMSRYCPIALALNRQLPGQTVIVCYGWLYISGLQYKATREHTGVLERFAFSCSANWVPTTFDIEAL